MIPETVQTHLEAYWARTRNSFELGDIPLAAFFAITLIEEIGKVVLVGNAKLSGELNQKAFRNHEAKYAFAVYSTLLVNSRVTRLYGAVESRFANWFRNGDLFKLRNSALYFELENNAFVVPSDCVQRADAFLLVCIAGEVLAEIQGAYTATGPDQWSEILSQVDQFRTRFREELV